MSEQIQLIKSGLSQNVGQTKTLINQGGRGHLKKKYTEVEHEP